MKLPVLSILLVSACTNGATRSEQTDEAATDREARGPDLVSCLAAAESLDAGAQASYCAKLSPASRQDRCTEHASQGIAERREWCFAEWRDKRSIGVATARSAPGDTNVDDCPQSDPCCSVSPIVFDIDGDGFALTSASNGVMFDL